MDYYKLKVLNNKKKILIVVTVLIIITVICYYFIVYKSKNEDKSIIIENSDVIEKDNNSSSLDNIYVDIKGFVNKPGVYSFKLTDNARVNDLILKAGGLKKDADTSTINLSKKLDDEMTVIVYSKSEINNYLKKHPKTGVLIITHYPRILEYIKPQFVHMMVCGKIVKTGNYDLAFEIEKKGYSDTSIISDGEKHE